MIESNKKSVGIIFGGKSNEHNVSIASAKAIVNAFRSSSIKERFDIKLFYITKAGKWINDSQSTLVINGDLDLKEISKDNYWIKEDNCLHNFNSDEIDIWLPILHGLNGEDGSIQGFLSIQQKPFIGSGILGSCLGMDKISMKLIFSQLKIPQVNYFPVFHPILTQDEELNSLIERIVKALHFPMFIKPSNSGSSLGISKVLNKSEIKDALIKAWQTDNRILIEEGHEVRELECGIIGKNTLLASTVGEVEYASDWYDYESKYCKDNKIIIPAKIDIDTEKKIKELSIYCCEALNITGFARADFFLDKKSNRIYLNEINTIPGFTDKSMFPMLWAASGLKFDQLVARLVDITFES